MISASVSPSWKQRAQFATQAAKSTWANPKKKRAILLTGTVIANGATLYNRNTEFNNGLQSINGCGPHIAKDDLPWMLQKSSQPTYRDKMLHLSIPAGFALQALTSAHFGFTAMTICSTAAYPVLSKESTWQKINNFLETSIHEAENLKHSVNEFLDTPIDKK